ncbi:hypothetical protein [Aeromicrobium sp.]|uniref:hypothetical protein n=1 Tax=Aeromicrobium sp. TaxID=1871063 RepID=UPI002FC79C68
MSTVRRRRLAATALATTALLTLGGCGTGFEADTNRVYQAAVGADHRGEIDVLNTLLVANDDGSATLAASIVNNTDAEQKLASVTITTLDGKDLTVRSTEKALKLPAGMLTPVDGTSDAGGFWVTEGAEAGDYVKVTLNFSEAAQVTIEAPVVARTEEYAKIASEPTPEPSATPSETETTEDLTE